VNLHQVGAPAATELFGEAVAELDGVGGMELDRDGDDTGGAPVHAVNVNRPAPNNKGHLIMGIRRRMAPWRSSLRD